MVPCTSMFYRRLFLHSATKPLWHLQNEQQGSVFLTHGHLCVPHFRQLQWVANASGIGLASIFGVRRSSTSSKPYCVGSRRSCVVGVGQGSIQKNWDPLLISATVEASNFKFSTQLGFGTSLPKNNVLDQNWRGCGPAEHPKKFGTPTYFCNR